MAELALVVGPPREQPIQLARLFYVGRVPMNTHHARVDHLDIAITGLGTRIQDAVPRTGLAPVGKMVVADHAWAAAFRQVTPPRC